MSTHNFIKFLLIQTKYALTEGHYHSMGGGMDEINASNAIYRIIELEESDKETIHLLIFLLMQFMSRADLVKFFY